MRHKTTNKAKHKMTKIRQKTQARQKGNTKRHKHETNVISQTKRDKTQQKQDKILQK